MFPLTLSVPLSNHDNVGMYVTKVFLNFQFTTGLTC